MAELSLLDVIKAGGIGKARAAEQAKRRDVYRPILGKFGAETAAEIGPLVTSDDPAAVQSGQSLLASLLQQTSPDYKQGLAQGEATLKNTQQAGEYAAAEEARRQALFPGQLQHQQEQIRGQQQSYAQQQALFPLHMQQAQNAIEANRAQIEASGLGANAKQLTFFNTVRGQYQALPAVKTAVEAQGAYKAAMAAANTGSALGAELALVKMAKLADPTSVVREGETERIREGYGLMSQVSSSLRKAGSKGMTAEQRTTYLDALDALYGPAMELAAAATRQYQNFEVQYGARPGEFTTGVGLDWSILPGAWKQQATGQAAEVRQWPGGR